MTSMILWMQALPGTRCLHTGNVLPVSILLTDAKPSCCPSDCDRTSGISSQRINGRSCFVEAPFDATSVWKANIASIQSVMAFVRLHLLETTSQSLQLVVSSDSRAPPWSARRVQLSYLTYRTLLI